jgi:rod shape-determining protein MreC
MEFAPHRFRNITVLLVVIVAQLVLLAYQVKTNNDMRLIRVWAVTAVTPFARVLETAHDGVMRILKDYVLLHDTSDENRRLQQEVGRLKLRNQFLANELASAERAPALAAFQQRTPSRTIPARVIGTGTGANARVVFVDRGTVNGVTRGMAVITPDGIIGRVLAAYPTASQVMLITDSAFAAGVVSQRYHVVGTLKGQGQDTCMVDYIQNEEKVEAGDVFYTSGDDRVFPKGLPVGVVKVARPGAPFKQIFVVPAGLQNGIDEVLIVLEGVHQQIPEYKTPAASPLALLPAPPEEEGEKSATASPIGTGTAADRLREKYLKSGEAQKHVYGEGYAPPNFVNLDGQPKKPGAAPSAPRPPAATAGTGL